MKRLLAFFISFSACWLPVRGQSLHVDSTRFITGDNPGTSIRFAIPTADKGILFVGEDYGNPGGIIPYFPIDMGVNGNVLIGKIDSNQQISWIKVYGGTQEDLAYSACQSPDGGYAILCYTESNDGNITGYKGNGDIWLIKTDANGNLLWQKNYGSSDQDIPMSIANTPDHGFIISGTTNGSDGDVPIHYGIFYSFDWIVIKTDSIGNKQWSKDLGTTGDEQFYGSILSIDSSYYLISATDSNNHDCTDTVWHSGIYTKDDYYILKLDDTGKVLWDSSYGGSSEDAVNYAMFDSRDSTIVIAGSTNSNDYMVTGYQGSGDMWVIKVDKHGKLIWEKTLGGSQQESGTGICVAPHAGYLIYGSTYPGPIGGLDCWLFDLDSTATEIKEKVFGGTDDEDPTSIVPYLAGYVAVGTSASSIFTEGSCDTNYSGAFVSYIDSGTLGLNNINSIKNKVLLLSPNPANGVVKIITPAEGSANLSIINIMGKVVYEEKFARQTDEITLNIQSWVNGFYLVKWLSSDGNLLTCMFVKE